MKKILYLTNIEVPYRSCFFNELAKCCELTVLYESRGTGTRNTAWAKSVASQYRAKYLSHKRTGRYSMDIAGMIKEITSGYDWVVVGCYNSRIQMLAILFMRMFGIPYMINLDGEPFLDEPGLKKYGKRFFLKGADKYLAAGEKTVPAIRKLAKEKEIVPYFFSGLTNQQLLKNRQIALDCKRKEEVLVVGRYLHCKGMDLILDVARMDHTVSYKIIGMGNQTEQFEKEYADTFPENVTLIPFLQKEELEKEYQSCAVLVLPSRKECWGLVINEAASFGTPIVSTWGSGAAVEFLSEEYPQYLAPPADAQALYDCIQEFLHSDEKEAYSQYLLKKSECYSIERSVQEHIRAFGK